jgi:hypothetical protein
MMMQPENEKKPQGENPMALVIILLFIIQHMREQSKHNAPKRRSKFDTPFIEVRCFIPFDVEGV